MKFLIAFGTDDGENLNNDHVVMAKYFYVYEFSNGKEQLVERRENVHFKGDESMHGDPEKAGKRQHCRSFHTEEAYYRERT